VDAFAKSEKQRDPKLSNGFEVLKFDFRYSNDKPTFNPIKTTSSTSDKVEKFIQAEKH